MREQLGVIAPRNARAKFVSVNVKAERLRPGRPRMGDAEIADQSEPVRQIVGDGAAASIHIKLIAVDDDVRAHIRVAAKDLPLWRVLRVRGRSRAQRKYRRQENCQQNVCASHRHLP